MNLFQAPGFPFANADLTKTWVSFKLPSFKMDALFEVHRKNAEALTNANHVVFDGIMRMAQRQGELFTTTVNDYSKVTRDVLAGASFEERATKQADAAQHIHVSTFARFRELSDIAVKANVTAVDILNGRVAEAFDELRALFVAPVAHTTTTSLAPMSVIAEPDAVVEEVAPVGDAVVPVEPKPTVIAPPTTAPKTKTAAPATKATRRPTSRS